MKRRLYDNPMLRYYGERLTNNRAINKCAWCKTCVFRDRQGELGPEKCFCGVYTMDHPKPTSIMLDNCRCDFYERDPEIQEDE